MDDAFAAGAAAGRDIGQLAVDCPHPPTDPSGKRGAWLRGFSSTRAEASPASDPAHADHRAPDDADPSGLPPLHEG